MAASAGECRLGSVRARRVGFISVGRLRGTGRAFAGAGDIADGVEPVAGSPDGHDLEPQLAEAAELLPQPADMDIHRLAVAQVVVAPDLLQQDLAGKDSSG